MSARAFQILLVESDPGDAKLAREALAGCRSSHELCHVTDGTEALACLRGQGRFAGLRRPDLVLLDINLPKQSGAELLAEIKTDRQLRYIPVIVFTRSEAAEDIHAAYNLWANCYVTKPRNLQQYTEMFSTIQDFWFHTVRLPPTGPSN